MDRIRFRVFFSLVSNKSLFFPLGHPDIDSSVFVDLQQLQLQLRQFQGIVIYSNSLLDNALQLGSWVHYPKETSVTNLYIF